MSSDNDSNSKGQLLHSRNHFAEQKLKTCCVLLFFGMFKIFFSSCCYVEWLFSSNRKYFLLIRVEVVLLVWRC